MLCAEHFDVVVIVVVYCGCFALKEIPLNNWEMHEINCRRHHKYHLVPCVTCGMKIPESDMLLHLVTCAKVLSCSAVPSYI